MYRCASACTTAVMAKPSPNLSLVDSVWAPRASKKHLKLAPHFFQAARVATRKQQVQPFASKHAVQQLPLTCSGLCPPAPPRIWARHCQFYKWRPAEAPVWTSWTSLPRARHRLLHGAHRMQWQQGWPGRGVAPAGAQERQCAGPRNRPWLPWAPPALAES